MTNPTSAEDRVFAKCERRLIPFLGLLYLVSLVDRLECRFRRAHDERGSRFHAVRLRFRRRDFLRRLFAVPGARQPDAREVRRAALGVHDPDRLGRDLGGLRFRAGSDRVSTSCAFFWESPRRVSFQASCSTSPIGFRRSAAPAPSRASWRRARLPSSSSDRSRGHCSRWMGSRVSGAGSGSSSSKACPRACSPSHCSSLSPTVPSTPPGSVPMRNASSPNGSRKNPTSISRASGLRYAIQGSMRSASPTWRSAQVATACASGCRRSSNRWAFRISPTASSWRCPYLLAVGAMIWWGHSSDRTGERIWHVVLPVLLAAFGFAIGAACPSSDLIVFIGITLVIIGLDAVIGPFWSFAVLIPARSGGRGRDRVDQYVRHRCRRVHRSVPSSATSAKRPADIPRAWPCSRSVSSARARSCSPSAVQ